MSTDFGKNLLIIPNPPSIHAALNRSPNLKGNKVVGILLENAHLLLLLLLLWAVVVFDGRFMSCVYGKIDSWIRLPDIGALQNRGKEQVEIEELRFWFQYWFKFVTDP